MVLQEFCNVSVLVCLCEVSCCVGYVLVVKVPIQVAYRSRKVAGWRPDEAKF
jgi:hypothetical protein